MKIVTKLTGTISESPFQEPPIHHHHIGQSHPRATTNGRQGVYTRHIRCGPAGIIFSNGTTEIAIPADELWSLAEKHEPNLRIPEKIEAPGAAGTPPPQP